VSAHAPWCLLHASSLDALLFRSVLSCLPQAAHQGDGSEAAGARRDLGGPQEEGEDEVQPLRRVRVQLGGDEHGRQRNRLRAREQVSPAVVHMPGR